MPLLSSDYEFLQNGTAPLASYLRGASVLLTGGTGIVGSWLLEALLTADLAYGLGLTISVLTRDPDRFRARRPHLAVNPIVTLIPGDIRSFNGLPVSYDYIIHAAAESYNLSGSRMDMVDTVLDGTRRLLGYAERTRPEGMLYVSSNAVYGRAPGGPAFIDEDARTGPVLSDPNVEYDESKRMAEALCSLYFVEHALQVKIARCFPMVGPYLPLDAHFAVGNFIRDGLAGGPILVKGDGAPIRSYLYLADVAIWLLTILVEGAPGSAYNVGSDTPVTIAELAHNVAGCFDPAPVVEIGSAPAPGALVTCYVPSTKRATLELGLSASFTLEEALVHTIDYCRARMRTGE